MHLKHYSPEKLSDELKRAIYKHLDSKEFSLFYFGSRVSGSHHERSDIDVGIEGEERVQEVVLNKIRDELENIPTLYSIDLVDFQGVPDRFYKTASKHKEHIN